jgi:hypothetical protein
MVSKGYVIANSSKNINTLSALFRQLPKQDTPWLNTILGWCMTVEKELRRVQSRRLNGIKKVHYYESIKISPYPARFFHQPRKQDTLQPNIILGVCINTEKGSRQTWPWRLNGIKKVCCEFFKISTHSVRFFRQLPSQDEL